MTEEEELDFGEDELFDSNYSPSRLSPVPTPLPLSHSTSRRTQPSLVPSTQISSRSTLDPSVTTKENANLFDSDGRRLPPNWLSKLSATTGNTYYKDTRTGLSHWEIPQTEWDTLRDSDTPPLEDPTPPFPSQPFPHSLFPFTHPLPSLSATTTTIAPTSTISHKPAGTSNGKSNAPVSTKFYVDRDREGEQYFHRMHSPWAGLSRRFGFRFGSIGRLERILLPISIIRFSSPVNLSPPS